MQRQLRQRKRFRAASKANRPEFPLGGPAMVLPLENQFSILVSMSARRTSIRFRISAVVTLISVSWAR